MGMSDTYWLSDPHHVSSSVNDYEIYERYAPKITNFIHVIIETLSRGIIGRVENIHLFSLLSFGT